MKVGTVRPDITGLDIVLRAAGVLTGERNSPELPIPETAIRAYAERYRLSGTFVGLVMAYDRHLMGESRKALKRIPSGGTTTAKTPAKTTAPVLPKGNPAARVQG